MKKHIFALALFCASLAAGCGGGGGPTITYPDPTTAPMETVTFSVAIPGGTAMRRRSSISSSAQSVTITLVTVPPATPAPPLVINVNGGSNCTPSGSGMSCTGTMSLPAGQQQLIVSTYDQPGGAGSQLSTGSITIQVATSGSNGVNLSNNVALTLNSIVASVKLSVTPNSLSVSAQQTISMSLNAYDATGAIIIGSGSYAQGPIFVQIPALNPYFPGLKGPTVATFTGPGPAQTIDYDQTACYTNPQGGSLTFTASGVNITPATATLTFAAGCNITVTTPTPGASLTPAPTPTPTPKATPTPVPQFNVSPSEITFAGVAPQATQTFTASETGVSSFTAQSANSSIATVTGNGGSTFTVTAGSTAGQTGITVSDPSGRTATVTVTVNGQIIIISTKGASHR